MGTTRTEFAAESCNRPAAGAVPGNVERAPPELAPLEERLPAELPRLLAYLRRLAGGTRPPLDAEDLVQDVMQRALHYRHAYDPSRPLFPWLRQMAFRTFVSRLAEARRAPICGADEAREPREASREGRGVELREQVEQLLSTLSPTEAEVLRRFHLRAQPVAEIATSMGLPEGTVKSHLHRARRQLAARGDGGAR